MIRRYFANVVIIDNTKQIPVFYARVEWREFEGSVFKGERRVMFDVPFTSRYAAKQFAESMSAEFTLASEGRIKELLDLLHGRYT